MWKSTKVYKSFPFYQPRILEKEHSRQSKIFGINHFKLLCIKKITTADLCIIGLKMRK